MTISFKRMTAVILVWVLFLSLFPIGTTTSVTLAATSPVTKLKVKSSVSFRDAPSTSSNVMRYLKTGEIVIADDWVTPGWYAIHDASGKTGYVTTSSTYIGVYSNASVVSATSFKSAATSTSSNLRTLSIGEELFVMEKINSYWYKAKDTNGVTGYVTTNSNVIATDFSVIRVILPLAERIESIISKGLSFSGTPYEFGSTRYDDSTFDCSDFVQTSFWEAVRTSLPGDSSSQGDFVEAIGKTSVDWRQLKRGDLLFFMSYKGSSASNYTSVNKLTEPITHVGIYLGDGQVLHTYSIASGGVQVTNFVGTPWEYRILFGGSVY